ncbi:MAG: hypothetical protein HFH93_08170 [Lachnospiraceae bacterium]|nr:hypothetical protein [Lachnospiraceae bacterium]
MEQFGKKGFWRRGWRPAAAALILTLLVPARVHADYRYDSFGNAIPSQYAYVAETDYNGLQLGVGAFNGPTDLYVDREGRIYIVDAGNDRVVILNQDYELYKVIDSFRLDGEAVSVKGVTGIFVHTDGLLYMADKSQGRILVADEEGNVVRVITRPESNLLEESSTTTFLPRKVLVDSRDIVYMLSENSTQGAYMIDASGSFLGFYGRNEVQLTWQRVYELAKRRFASEEQRSKMQNFIPVEFANFDIDREGFIYTVTAYSESPMEDDMIKKLNPLGNNIYTDESMTWGDMPDYSGEKPVYNTTYTDIAVDGDGFAYALDAYSGRVFWFDNAGFQQAIFGGRGAYLGAFSSPVAVDTLNGDVLVLDGIKNNLTVFEPTYFGNLVREAYLLLNQGFYGESRELFEEIVRMDANYEWAYIGLGRAYYEDGDWEKAQECFERSKVATGWYSEVKEDIRNQSMKAHFTGIFFGILAACAVLIIASKLVAAYLKEQNEKAVAAEIGGDGGHGIEKGGDR